MSAGPPLEKTLLKLFAEAKKQTLPAKSLKDKIAPTASKSPIKGIDPSEFDQAITALIAAGKIALTGGGKTGHHPRPKGSYSLTGAGKDHVKPTKPEVSDDLLASQEAYLLIQFFRIKGGVESMSRSDLNGKLKTKAAKEKLELDPRDNKDAIDYHLHNLLSAGSLEERRQGVSTIYTLIDDGRRALGLAKQYDDIPFTLTGAALNALLGAARDSTAKHHPKAAHHAEESQATPEPAHHAPTKKSHPLEPQQIHDYIAQLKADKFAGRDLIPIHEVRSLVAHHHGTEAASHPTFDPMLKRMRSEGELEIIAIADSRDTPQQHLDDSIPGMNETLFFIDTE